MPSAGHALDWNLLLQIKKRGIKLASLTHAAGISSTGEPVLDAFLPLPERYDLPQETVNQILETKAKGKRVIAVGTSVVRALESAVHLRAGIGRTELRLNSDYKLRVVDGVLSGMHDTAESHFQLLSTFASKNLLQEMLNFAEKKGYLNHEFGDSCLILTK